MSCTHSLFLWEYEKKTNSNWCVIWQTKSFIYLDFFFAATQVIWSNACLVIKLIKIQEQQFFSRFVGCTKCLFVNELE